MRHSLTDRPPAAHGCHEPEPDVGSRGPEALIAVVCLGACFLIAAVAVVVSLMGVGG